MGEKGRRIRELTSVVQKRFRFPENTVELYAERVPNRALCAVAQAESLKYKLLGGLAVRRYVPINLTCLHSSQRLQLRLEQIMRAKYLNRLRDYILALLYVIFLHILLTRPGIYFT